MKKRYLVFTLALGMMACNKPPVACLETDASNVSTGTVVEFSSCSEKALSYAWFMEGPATAPENELGWSDENFSHEFTVPGTYTVTLTAYKNYSWEGESSETSTTIIVN